MPLPWTPQGSSFGFGAGGAHLPQPDWFAEYAASTQEEAAGSTLNLYRQALALRHELQGAEELEWQDTGNDQVLAFTRPGGWLSVTNFGNAPVQLPDGELLLATQPVHGRTLPAHTTAWLRA